MPLKHKLGSENLDLERDREREVFVLSNMLPNTKQMETLIEQCRVSEGERGLWGARGENKEADKVIIVLGGGQNKGRLWRLVVMMIIC